MQPVLKLRRFLETSRPPEPPAGQSCEFCSARILERHSHVVEIEARRLLCVCRACYLLFTHPGAAQGRYRAVPERCVHAPALALSEAQWDELNVPVSIAFFFRSSAAGRVTAFYPSPAGATASSLPLETWNEIAAANPLLSTLEADVEALLVRRLNDAFDCYLVPIDACYELVGLVRRHWHGFDGGPDARRAIEDFFAGLRARSDQ